MQPQPEGLWGMPKDMIEALPGYSGAFSERQAEAKRIMEKLGYSPSNRLKVKLSARDFASYKDAAVNISDQLNRIYFDAEVEIIESTIWFGRAARQDYAIAFNITSSGIDEPDVVLVENFACKSQINFTKYCNPEVDKLLALQSVERDRAKRREIVWQIEQLLAEELARPVIQHGRSAQCWQPWVKGHMRQENSIHNAWRLERVWIEK
jgi:peptide/nickel transport system substrate-binding protein